MNEEEMIENKDEFKKMLEFLDVNVSDKDLTKLYKRFQNIQDSCDSYSYPLLINDRYIVYYDCGENKLKWIKNDYGLPSKVLPKLAIAEINSKIILITGMDTETFDDLLNEEDGNGEGEIYSVRSLTNLERMTTAKEVYARKRAIDKKIEARKEKEEERKRKERAKKQKEYYMIKREQREAQKSKEQEEAYKFAKAKTMFTKNKMTKNNGYYSVTIESGMNLMPMKKKIKAFLSKSSSGHFLGSENASELIRKAFAKRQYLKIASNHFDSDNINLDFRNFNDDQIRVLRDWFGWVKTNDDKIMDMTQDDYKNVARFKTLNDFGLDELLKDKKYIEYQNQHDTNKKIKIKMVYDGEWMMDMEGESFHLTDYETLEHRLSENDSEEYLLYSDSILKLFIKLTEIVRKDEHQKLRQTLQTINMIENI